MPTAAQSLRLPRWLCQGWLAAVLVGLVAAPVVAAPPVVPVAAFAPHPRETSHSRATRPP